MRTKIEANSDGRNYLEPKERRVWMTYGEPGRDLEGTDDESRFDSVDSDAFESEILVEAPPRAASVSWNSESRNDVGLFVAQLQKLVCRVHIGFPPFFADSHRRCSEGSGEAETF